MLHVVTHWIHISINQTFVNYSLLTEIRNVNSMVWKYGQYGMKHNNNNNIQTISNAL